MSASIQELNIDDLESSDVTLDYLTPTWNIFQLKKGHRFSADDIFTAYLATRLQPNAMTCLDLGAGIGTVGLLTLYGLSRRAHLRMVEAQTISHQLAKKTIALNNLAQRVTAVHGDIRQIDTHAPNMTFDLVTGSPPYIPLGKGVVSPHPQRAACRMELRGSVIDYVAAAAKKLNPNGLFVICFAAHDKRCIQAIERASLKLICKLDIIFRHDLPPTISIYAATRNGERPQMADEQIIIRNQQGQFTDAYLSIRKIMWQPI